jgi:hypothetical protein
MSTPCELVNPTVTSVTSEGPVLPFRAPLILALAKVSPSETYQSNYWSTKILVSSLIKNNRNNPTSLSSSSGVSTLKSGRSSNCWSNHSNRSKASTSSLGISSLQNPSPSISSSTTNLAAINAASATAANTCNPIIEFTDSIGNDMKLSTMLYGSYIEFPEFVNLFKAFYVNMRKDLKDLYDRYAVLVSSGREGLSEADMERTWQSVRKYWKKLIYENNLQSQTSNTEKTSSNTVLGTKS